MTPVLNAAFSYMNARVYADLSGQKRSVPRFTASVGDTKTDSIKIMDARPETFWSNNKLQQEGQWYCLDHGSPISISNICLVTGGSRHNDYPATVQFEVSDDATNWQPVGKPQHGNMAIVHLSKSPSAHVTSASASPRRGTTGSPSVNLPLTAPFPPMLPAPYRDVISPPTATRKTSASTTSWRSSPCRQVKASLWSCPTPSTRNG